MPTYEYRCTGCRRRIEVQQSFTDAHLENCELCGERLRRIFSPVGVLFKGSGFYSTDARSGAKKSEKQGGNGEKRSDKAKSGDSSKEPSGEGSKERPKEGSKTENTRNSSGEASGGPPKAKAADKQG